MQTPDEFLDRGLWLRCVRNLARAGSDLLHVPEGTRLSVIAVTEVTEVNY
jgi:hypothetical protein